MQGAIAAPCALALEGLLSEGGVVPCVMASGAPALFEAAFEVSPRCAELARASPSIGDWGDFPKLSIGAVWVEMALLGAT